MWHVFGTESEQHMILCGSIIFLCFKLYLENNKPEKIDENNNVLKKLMKGVIMNEQKIYILV